MKWTLLAASTTCASAYWVDVPPPYSGAAYEATGLTYEALGAVDGNGKLLDTMGLAHPTSPFLPDNSTTAVCSEACQDGVAFPDSSESYVRCHSFLDTFVPNEREKLDQTPNGTDFTGYEFRIDTNVDTPQGCTFDPTNKVLYYNQNRGTGECSAQRQCICQCKFATESPTASPVASVENHTKINAGTDNSSIPCSVMPNDSFGNPNGVPIDLAIYDYTQPTVDANNVITSGADFTVRPWVNWLDSDLFNQDAAFPFSAEKASDEVVVSGWLDFVAPLEPFTGGESTPDYPYQRLKTAEDSSCRVIMNEEGRFDNHEVLHADGCTFATADNTTANLHRHTGEVVWTNYSFYVASTICYTVQPVDLCHDTKNYGKTGDRTWQSDAYTAPTEWKAAYTEYIPATTGGTWNSSEHVAQCRREWQAVRLRVKYGGEVSILDTVTLDVVHVVQQPDGAIDVPESEESWQKYDDFEAQQLDFSHFENGDNTGRYKFQTAPTCTDNECTGGTVEGTKDTTTAGDGQQLIEFTKFYQWKFEVDDTIFFGDKNLQQLVLDQYNALEASFTWQRCLEQHAPCTLDEHWQNLDDYYLVDATTTGTNGAVSYLNNHVGGQTIDYTTQQSESIVDFSVNSGLRIINNAHIEDDIRLNLVMTWSDAAIPKIEYANLRRMDDAQALAGGYIVGGVEATECGSATVGGVACTSMTRAQCEAYSYKAGVGDEFVTTTVGVHPPGCFRDREDGNKVKFGIDTAVGVFTATRQGLCNCPNPDDHAMAAEQTRDSNLDNNVATSCGNMERNGDVCRDDLTYSECETFATSIGKVFALGNATLDTPRCYQDNATDIVYFKHNANYDRCTATEKCICSCPVESARRRLSATHNVYPRRLHEEDDNHTTVNIELKILLPEGHVHTSHADDDDGLTTEQTVVLAVVLAVFALGIGYWIMADHGRGYAALPETQKVVYVQGY